MAYRSPPSPSPTPAPVPVPEPEPALAPLPLAWADFQTAQLADQQCLPWNWLLHGKVTAEYTPVVPGKWWSSLPATSERNTSHIGRIMETELGE
jgi:hypothetical protein